MQEAPSKCPACGLQITPGAPKGLCPRCLLLQGLETLPELPLIPDSEQTNNQPGANRLNRKERE